MVKLKQLKQTFFVCNFTNYKIKRNRRLKPVQREGRILDADIINSN